MMEDDLAEDYSIRKWFVWAAKHRVRGQGEDGRLIFEWVGFGLLAASLAFEALRLSGLLATYPDGVLDGEIDQLERSVVIRLFCALGFLFLSARSFIRWRKLRSRG